MQDDDRPALICARVHSGQRAVPGSIVRRCELCSCQVLTAPSSQPLITQERAHIYCTACGVNMMEIDGADHIETLPGALDEAERILGPAAAERTRQVNEILNREIRRRSN